MIDGMKGVALDLGTTNAVAAMVEDGMPRAVPLRGKAQTLPSVVAVDERGRWLVGRDARAQLYARPADTIVGMKALVGRSMESTGFQQLLDGLDYKVVRGPDGPAAQVGGAKVSLVDAAAMVLRDLKGQAQDNIGRQITKALIPVPDYFTDAQREAIIEAGKRSGLETVDVADESECLTRLVQAAGREREMRQVFLYGLGGGVFDATVLERTPSGTYEVVASTGEDLGGSQFDRRIASHLHDAFVRQHALGTFSDPVGRQRILEAAEAAKIRLDDTDTSPVHVPFLAADPGEGTPLDLELTLDRAALIRLTGDLVKRTLAVARSVLRAARVEPEEIDAVLLYGRPVRAREIHAATSRFFDQSPVRLPDDAPALGASLLAAERGIA